VNPNIPTRPLPLTFRPFGPPIGVEDDAYASPHGYRDPATLRARDVCPHCRCETTRHRFTTPDGVWLETHHCRQHGDVAPMRSVIIRED
jgi:hypothetical protein